MPKGDPAGYLPNVQKSRGRRPPGNFNQLFLGGQKKPPSQSMWRGGRVEENGKPPAEMTPKKMLAKRRAAGKYSNMQKGGGGFRMERAANLPKGR